MLLATISSPANQRRIERSAAPRRASPTRAA